MWLYFDLFSIFSTLHRLDLHDEACDALADLQCSIDKNHNGLDYH